MLIDEAYHHYADGGGYESVLPLLAEHPNLIVMRTFSKIFGMAGLRCGYAIGRPEMLDRLYFHKAMDSLNIQALAASRAALRDTAHLERSRHLNREVRTWVAGELAARSYPAIPSQANFLMTDLRRDVGQVIEALRNRQVDGTRPQMERFLGALKEVLAAA